MKYHYTIHNFTTIFITYHNNCLAVHRLVAKLLSCLTAIFLRYKLHANLTNPISIDTWPGGEAPANYMWIIHQRLSITEF